VLGHLGTVAITFVVAVIAVAAAAAGPVYYSAAQTSILRDTATSAAVLARGYEVTQTGPVAMSFASLTANIDADLGSATRLFSAPVQAREATAFYPSGNEALQLVSRTGVCGHLDIEGSCPNGAGEVLVGRQLAALNGWKDGQRVTFPSWGPLTISGIYTAPSATDYWFDRLSVYFPTEYPSTASGRAGPASSYDAMFTSSSTLLSAPPSAQGTIVIDSTLSTGRLQPRDVHTLSFTLNALVGDPQLAGLQAIVDSAIPATMEAVTASWSSLAVPVVVTTLELLALAGLLLFLLATDATAARGPEIALAKLRGYRTWRTAVFGLSEPLLTVAIAFPVGAAVGWGATVALSHALLRAGTPIGFPALGWATAAVAAGGGFVAVVAASQGTLRRPVMDQWRQSSERRTGRGWVVDAVVLTGAVGGLIELEVSGTIDTSHQHPLTLLVPGLVGLAVAVIGSRLLPWLCSGIAKRSRRVGVAGYLALRQVARRPGGTRTTMILAASFALAAFGVSAWSLAETNYRSVAYATLGAPTVVDVSTPPGIELGAAVAYADPSGRQATPVEEYGGNGSTVLAVDPSSWDRIAHWSSGPLSASVLAALNPPAPAPVVLHGDGVRLHLDIDHLSPALSGLTLDVLTPTGLAPTPVQFPALPDSGTITETATLPACPCTVEDLTIAADPALGASSSLQGTVTVAGVDIHQPTGWQPLPSADLVPTRWQTTGAAPTSSLESSPVGLQWTFDSPGVDPVSILDADRPIPLPAVAARGVTSGRGGPYTAVGLNGQDLPLDVLATVSSVPGVPAGGVVVDRAYAEAAAEGNLTGADQQVWLAPGAPATVLDKLRAQGVTVNSVQSTATLTRTLSRSGPGLAQVLFVSEAGVAALLAAGSTILSLYLFARRRRYELASLVAVGVPRRTLLGAVIAEQLIVLLYGALVGIGAGLVTAALVLRDIPEFQSSPGVALATFPPGRAVAVILAFGVGVTIAAAVAAGASLVRGVTLSELRGSPT